MIDKIIERLEKYKNKSEKEMDKYYGKILADYYNSYDISEIEMESFKKAIDIVKQVAEEHKGCEYCDGETYHDRADIISDGDIEASIDTDNTLYVAYSENEWHYKDSCIKINYCPMCGRPLKPYKEG